MVDIICMGLLELQEHKESEKYKIKKSCPQWDLNPGYLHYHTRYRLRYEIRYLSYIKLTAFYLSV